MREKHEMKRNDGVGERYRVSTFHPSKGEARVVSVTTQDDEFNMLYIIFKSKL